MLVYLYFDTELRYKFLHGYLDTKLGYKFLHEYLDTKLGYILLYIYFDIKIVYILLHVCLETYSCLDTIILNMASWILTFTWIIRYRTRMLILISILEY